MSSANEEAKDRPAEAADVGGFMRANVPFRQRETFYSRAGNGDGLRYTWEQLAYILKMTRRDVVALYRRAKRSQLGMLSQFAPWSTLPAPLRRRLHEASASLQAVIGSLDSLDERRARLTAVLADLGFQDAQRIGEAGRKRNDLWLLRRDEPAPLGVLMQAEHEARRITVVDRFYGAVLSRRTTNNAWVASLAATVMHVGGNRPRRSQRARLLEVRLIQNDFVRDWLRGADWGRALWGPHSSFRFWL